jgi:hypothetical protein
MIRDILTDIVTHTSILGFPFAKVVSDKKTTVVESMDENRSVIVRAQTHNPVHEFKGTFGLPNLNILNLLLKNPEYKENPNIEIIIEKRNNKDIPVSIFFENVDRDFNNTYTLISQEVISAKLAEYEFAEPNWDIEFNPSIISIQRLKLQSQIHTEEEFFKSKVEKKNLIVSFGGIASTHIGSFVFQSNIEGKLTNIFNWPLQAVINILNLDGDKTMKISDSGLMMITVDSGLTVYDYIIPAVTK